MSAFTELDIIVKTLASILVGYILGSVPFAQVAARLRGRDIFSTGSRSAGTANVFWNVGRRTGTVVFMGDVGKGMLAIAVAGFMGLSGPLLLLPGGAAVLGHWNSIFTGFRGGDGMATLLGVTFALLPLFTLAGVVTGLTAVILSRRLPMRSVWGVLTCAATILAFSHYYATQRDLALGVTLMSLMVTFHTILTHRKRRLMPDDDRELQSNLRP